MLDMFVVACSHCVPTRVIDETARLPFHLSMKLSPGRAEADAMQRVKEP